MTQQPNTLERERILSSCMSLIFELDLGYFISGVFESQDKALDSAESLTFVNYVKSPNLKAYLDEPLIV
jgi:hypothetical protein